MGFWKTLFGGHEDSEEEKEEKKEQYNFEVLTFDGREALRVHKTDYGIACLERALTLREDADTRLLLANGYLQKDDLDKAAEQYAAVSELQPQNASISITLATLLYQLERYEEMCTACQHAIEVDGSQPQPHVLLARKALLRDDDTDTALAEASVAVELAPDLEEARLLRARILGAKERYAEAEADLDYLLQHADEPSDEVLMAKAALCQTLQRTNEAIDFYRRAINQNPFVPQSYIGLETLLQANGQVEEAQHVAEEAKEQFGMTAEEAANLKPNEGESMEEYMRKSYNMLNPFQLGV